MLKSLYMLIIATVAIVSVRAADDVSVVGAHSTPIAPDISVVGWHSGADEITPDVSVVGAATLTITGLPASATQTECYRVFETGGVTSTEAAQATVTDGTSPPGYRCYLVYATGGGTLRTPLPYVQAAQAPSQPTPFIKIGVPVIISVVGLLAIIGAVLVVLRIRARRAAAGKRTWVDRPGGWAKDNEPGKVESDVTHY